MASDDVARASARIAANFGEFERWLARSEQHLARNETDPAVLYGAIAAHTAVQAHCGIFWSPRLEKTLNEIGRRIAPMGQPGRRGKSYERILHVGTAMSPVGGLTKLLCEWVKADSERQHTLILTKHLGPTPRVLREVFKASGGQVNHLSHQPGTLLDWARRLRAAAREADAVMLHIHCEDVIPLIAFAEPENNPPILVMNHADHLFWLGPSISHLCINLRQAAQNLTIARRGIDARRQVIVPTPTASVVRARSRAEAKQALGIDPDAVLMVSVARQPKFKTTHGVTYADIHAPLLEEHKNAMLLVVGAGEPQDWAPVRARVGNRLRSIAETTEAAIYFEAADIYVDSYPFVSSTSMMEAASYGVPAATIFTAPPEAAIYAINHVALDGTVMQASSFDEYRRMVARLILDPDLRSQVGERARTAVVRDHNHPGWRHWLSEAYARAVELPALDNREMLDRVEVPHVFEPDIRHQDMFEGNFPTIERIKTYLGAMPIRHHLAIWNDVRRAGAFTDPISAVSYLLPEWVKRSLKDGLLNPTI